MYAFKLLEDAYGRLPILDDNSDALDVLNLDAYGYETGYDAIRRTYVQLAKVLKVRAKYA